MSTKRSTTSDEVQILIDAAEESVVALEQLAQGAPFAQHVARAQEVLEQLHARAAAEVFPDVEPAGADVLADYTFHAETMRQSTFGIEVAALHGASVTTHPVLARLLRGTVVRSRIAAAAAAQAGIMAHTEHELLAEAVTAYEQTVSAQLAACGEFQPWSGILGEVLPALRSRFLATKMARETAAVAALERVRVEAAETDRLLAQLQTEQEQRAVAVQVDSEAAARQAETHARQLRAQYLATRLRATGLQEIRLAGRRLYSITDFVQLLDQNALSHSWMDQIEEALDRKGVLA